MPAPSFAPRGSLCWTFWGEGLGAAGEARDDTPCHQLPALSQGSAPPAWQLGRWHRRHQLLFLFPLSPELFLSHIPAAWPWTLCQGHLLPHPCRIHPNRDPQLPLAAATAELPSLAAVPSAGDGAIKADVGLKSSRRRVGEGLRRLSPLAAQRCGSPGVS